MRKIARYSLALGFLLFISCSGSFAQNPQYAYRVSFAGKQATTHSLSAPSTYLSQRALERRTKYSIPVDSTDLPVVTTYIDSVLHITGGILHNTSRWQNSCVILIEDTTQIAALAGLSFVQQVKKVAYYESGLHQRPAAGPDEQSNDNTGQKPTGFDQNFYGAAWSQIHLCHGEYLHEQGFMGEGKLIAVIDVGFTGINAATAFDSMFTEGRLIDTWNYIYDTTHVFGYGAHGCQVLSCMASFMPESHVGTAPRAMYALYATDDANSEQAIEEDNFTSAAERADSLGADLISTSLGYNLFDDAADSYTYQDLDGHTTRVARTSNMATRKGIMVVASAGNEGVGSWQHILTPGDADSVMTVGSVNSLKEHAPSSGKGPNAAGVLKPNVSAQGVQAAIIASSGAISVLTGTSYATPVLAGLTACLMQAAPNLKPLEIRALIESVSDSAANPTNHIGNGVPDFQRAYEQVTAINDPVHKAPGTFTVYPNPARDKVFIIDRQNNGQAVAYSLYTIMGALVQKGQVASGGIVYTGSLAAGTYILRLSNGKQYQVQKLQLL